MLESLVRRGTNIKDLTGLQPLPGLLFDPRTKLSDKDWEAFSYGMDQEKDIRYFTSLFINTKTLAGSVGRPFIKTSPQELLEALSTPLSNLRKYKDDLGPFADHLNAIRWLFPDRLPEFLKEEDFNHFKSLIHESRRWGDGMNLTSRALMVATIFPDQFSQIDLSEQTFGVVQKDLNGLRNKHSYWAVAELAANARLLFPNRRNEIVTKSDWSKFQDQFDQTHHAASDYVAIASIARDLTILAAHSAFVDQQGMHIELDKPAKEVNLPTTRRF